MLPLVVRVARDAEAGAELDDADGVAGTHTVTVSEVLTGWKHRGQNTYMTNGEPFDPNDEAHQAFRFLAESLFGMTLDPAIDLVELEREEEPAA